MKRSLALALLVFLTIFIVVDAKTKPKKKLTPPCAANLAACSNEGCSSDNHHDPKLNRLKNKHSENGTITDRSLAWMKSRPNPKHYAPQGSRSELTTLGEGDQVRVVGYLLAAKLELGGESCNCYLHTEEETDNHLVLVTKATVDAFPLPLHASATTIKAIFKKREAQSVTVEFTPRVRQQDHPNFTANKLQPLINKTPQGALLVRVTGQLLFDSEHFFQHKLPRVNNWEVHPVFRFEYCPQGKTCTATSDNNWVDLDQ